MYLKAWAQDNRVAFRRRDMDTAKVAAVENVGAVNHLHTDEAEQLFGKTESAADEPLRRLRAGDSDLSDTDREALAWFVVELFARQIYMFMFMGLSPETLIAIINERRDTDTVLQLLRADHGPGINRSVAERLQRNIAELFRERRQKHAEQNTHLTDADIERRVLEQLESQAPEMRSLVVAPEQSADAKRLRADAKRLWDFVLTKPWQICESPRYEFITSDQPVFWHPIWLNLTSDQPLDTLCFVVSPTTLLKITATPENPRWGKKKVFGLNSYIAKHCDHQIIATPSNTETLNHLRLDPYRPWVYDSTH